MEWQFFIELVTNGVLTGLMYALVAVGFVLIYKSTDAINFAQGEFCMIAAIIVAGVMKLYGFPLWPASPQAWCSCWFSTGDWSALCCDR